MYVKNFSKMTCLLLVIIGIMLITPKAFGANGEYTPISPTKNVQDEGIPILVDDFDGWMIDSDGELTSNMNHNAMIGCIGDSYENASISHKISSEPYNKNDGEAHSIPHSMRLSYSNLSSENLYQWVAYYNKVYISEDDSPVKKRDLSFTEKFSIWLKAKDDSNNPKTVSLEFQDSDNNMSYALLKNIPYNDWAQYWISLDDLITGPNNDVDFTKLKEICLVLKYSDISAANGATSGVIYVDDMTFVDAYTAFVNDNDFDLSTDENALANSLSNDFLNTIEERSFWGIYDMIDPYTGLVNDRIGWEDCATTATTGYGIAALAIGIERGWISKTTGADLVLKVLRLLADDDLMASDSESALNLAKNVTDNLGYSGYRGFFFHFLYIGLNGNTYSGRRKDSGTELSVVDTAILLLGAITFMEYFNDNYGVSDAETANEITELVNYIYDRVQWDWFLDTTGNETTNSSYHQFYTGWIPEWVDGNDTWVDGYLTGFKYPDSPKAAHWDFSTDEAMLMILLAIGAPNITEGDYSIPKDVFYKFSRFQRPYNAGGPGDLTRNIIPSYKGSSFTHFFANLWFDFYGNNGSGGYYRSGGDYANNLDPGDLYDEFGVNWWKNSINAGLADRDYCSLGYDGAFSTYRPKTLNENSWGLSATEAIPYGTFWNPDADDGNGAYENFHEQYYGSNGAPPFKDYQDTVNYQSTGVVPVYGGVSFLGFSRYESGIADSSTYFPHIYVRDMLQNFYQNTSLWTGLYGFRDAYTDDNTLNKIKRWFWDDGEDSYVDITAGSLYPAVKSEHFGYNQGSMLIMLENYRSGLIWKYAMNNKYLKDGMKEIFTGNLNLDKVLITKTSTDIPSDFVDNCNTKYYTLINSDNKEYACDGYISASDFTVTSDITVTFNPGYADENNNLVKLGPGFNVVKGTIFNAGDVDVQTGPEISVMQGSTYIRSDLDVYDLGVVQEDVIVDITFTIKNVGTSSLTLTGSPKVALSGDTGDFTVLTQPSSPIAAGGTGTFVVRCNPTQTGEIYVDVDIYSDDNTPIGQYSENPYEFVIEADSKSHVWTKQSSVGYGCVYEYSSNGVLYKINYGNTELYKSTDHGKTWELILRYTDISPQHSPYTITKIKYIDTDGTDLYVSIRESWPRQALIKSTDDGDTFVLQVYRPSWDYNYYLRMSVEFGKAWVHGNGYSSDNYWYNDGSSGWIGTGDFYNPDPETDIGYYGTKKTTDGGWSYSTMSYSFVFADESGTSGDSIIYSTGKYSDDKGVTWDDLGIVCSKFAKDDTSGLLFAKGTKSGVTGIYAVEQGSEGNAGSWNLWGLDSGVNDIDYLAVTESGGKRYLCVIQGNSLYTTGIID